GHRANPLPLWQESRCDQIGAELRCRPGQRRAGNLPQPVVAPVQLATEVGRAVPVGLKQPLFAPELEMTGSVGAAWLCQEDSRDRKAARNVRKLAIRAGENGNDA